MEASILPLPTVGAVGQAEFHRCAAFWANLLSTTYGLQLLRIRDRIRITPEQLRLARRHDIDRLAVWAVEIISSAVWNKRDVKKVKIAAVLGHDRRRRTAAVRALQAADNSHVPIHFSGSKHQNHAGIPPLGFL